MMLDHTAPAAGEVKQNGCGERKGQGHKWKTSLGCRPARHDHQRQQAAQGGGDSAGALSEGLRGRSSNVMVILVPSGH